MRAIGIVRVSVVGNRGGESFASPPEQRDRIKALCEREGFDLVSVAEELDVSGGTPLADRDGLREAVEAVEAGGAEVIVAAYFDRLVRSLKVQGEVVERVEAAGGKVMAVDVGAISAATAGQWISGTVLGAMNEYVRRAARERSGAAQARAVERGVPPFNPPPGYARDADGRFVPNDDADAVVVAFSMRAGGMTIKEIRTYLRKRGIVRSYHGVQAMLASRVYLGEIHFGKLVNTDAHLAIVSRDIWTAAQRVRVARGPRAKSERLLARLGILRCATCGGRMVVGSSHHGRYAIYRCSPIGDCPRRVTISAVIAERVVTEAVRAALADVEGRASAEREAREAVAVAEQAQADLDAAIRAFSGLVDEPVAAERLDELRQARDEAVSHAEQLGGLRWAQTVSVDDWDDLSIEAKRGLITNTIRVATVGQGRGAGRISVETFGE